MQLKPIGNDDDYAAALHEIDRLWDAADGSPEADTLETLVTLVEAYEKGRYELPPPDPICERCREVRHADNPTANTI